MVKLEETSLRILADIVEQNEGRTGYIAGCSMHCSDISCNECPMNTSKHLTLDMIRDEVNSRMTTKHSVLCDYERSAGKNPCTCKKSNDISGNSAEVVMTDGIEGVTKPSHYAFFDGIEAIEVIARSMSVEMFRGYCMGNMLKYRLRAGKKSELAYAEKDLAKANFYAELFETHKEKCYDYRHYQP